VDGFGTAQLAGSASAEQSMSLRDLDGAAPELATPEWTLDEVIRAER